MNMYLNMYLCPLNRNGKEKNETDICNDTSLDGSLLGRLCPTQSDF